MSQTLVMVDIALVVSTATIWNDAIAMTLVMNEAAAMMAFTAASITNEQPIILKHAIMGFQPLADILARHQKILCTVLQRLMKILLPLII
jgi:hypothetical protein